MSIEEIGMITSIMLFFICIFAFIVFFIITGIIINIIGSSKTNTKVSNENK